MIFNKVKTMIARRCFSALFIFGFTLFSVSTHATNFGDKTIAGTQPGTPYEKSINQVIHFLGASSKEVIPRYTATGFVNKLMGNKYPESVTIEHQGTKVILTFIPIKPYKTKNDIVVLSINMRKTNGILNPYDQLVSRFGKPSNVNKSEGSSDTYYWCENINQHEKYGCGAGKSLTARYDYVIYQNPDLSRHAVVDAARPPSL